jgi:hypothetical protein
MRESRAVQDRERAAPNPEDGTCGVRLQPAPLLLHQRRPSSRRLPSGEGWAAAVSSFSGTSMPQTVGNEPSRPGHFAVAGASNNPVALQEQHPKPRAPTRDCERSGLRVSCRRHAPARGGAVRPSPPNLKARHRQRRSTLPRWAAFAEVRDLVRVGIDLPAAHGARAVAAMTIPSLILTETMMVTTDMLPK